MENSERQKFEDDWKSAFQDAEQQPSDRVWWSIDNALTHTEGGSMKRKVIFYKRLAAASVILAMVVAGSTTYFVNESHDELTSEKNTPIQPESDSTTKPDNLTTITGNEKLQLTETNTTSRTTTSNVTSNVLAESTSNINSTSTIPLSLHGNKEVLNQQTFLPYDASHPMQGFALVAYDPLADHYAINLKTRGKPREVTIVRKLPAMPASMMAESRRKKADVKENLWAAVNASTGGFNSYAQSDNTSRSFMMASQSSSFNNMVSTSSQPKPTGNSYSVGINMGARLDKRWVLQGGVSYINQAQGYTSNFAAVGFDNTPKAIVAEYTGARQSLVAITPTTPYEINSVNEFVSVPVQAGYMVVNRKFGLQLNSGVATDMFVRNTLTDKSGQLDSFSESAGTDSPYNTFSWSALAGTEFSYKIGSQYRVSVAPGLRYALSPMLKTNTESTTPVMWDMGFRFRYIFK
ncbi:MAG: outer membrane beta-barrel protein [Cyclobacteriaceae bacterium]|nr:outer membrane beta-barrel protein [Cyclobacteriaceae bacterium]